MKILITGASGFLGQHIIKKLSDEGADLVALIRPTSKIEHLKPYKIHYIVGDIRNEESLQKAMQGVDAVVHAVTTKFGNEDDFYAENVESTRRLLELSRQQNIKRFVFISSIDVYDHAQCKNGTVLTEESPRDPHPSNPYGKTKIQAEELVEEYNRTYNVPTVIIRPGCIYGTGGNWVPARLGISAGARRYVLLGNGKSAVPMSHTSSVAEVIWQSIRKDSAKGKIYNVLEDGIISRVDFLKMVQAHLFSDFKIVKMPLFLIRF
ncbi:MAG: NAD(P)-dependent oxidoreductase, partial [bacterium]